MQKIYINTTTRQWFDTDGALFGSGSPQLAYKRTEEIALQLCSETPDAGTDGVNPETDWTKDTSFGVGGIGAKLSIDNDFLRRRKGTLSAAIPAGSVSTVTAAIEGASKATIRMNGILKVFDADGNAEALEYESASFNGNTVTFTLKSGSEVENSYSQGAEMDVPDALYAQAMMDPEKSDAATGLFVFNIVVYSEKLRSVMEYANIANLDTLAGMELLLFKTSGDTITELNNFLCTTVSLHATMAEANTLAQVPPSMTDELVSLITSTLGDVEYEYSEDGTSWHGTQTSDDNYLRFKLTGSGSSGTWIVFELKQGPQGTAPHIDSTTKHWYIGETDTGIVAEGQDGITPHIGANGHWYIGETDTGVAAELSGTYLTFSSVTDNEVTFTGTETLPIAVLTNAGHLYPIEKGSLTVDTVNNTCTVDVTPYLAYDNSATFSGTWRVYFSAGSNQQPIKLGPCTGLGFATSSSGPSFSWIDPDDVILNGAELAAWNQTVLVRKTGTSYPTSPEDGVILATTSRTQGNKNYYRDHSFQDTTQESGTDYSYMLFSQADNGSWNNLVANQFTSGIGLSWDMVKQYVRAGRGAELFPVGTVFYVDHPEYTHQDSTGLWFRVAGHDQVPAADESLTHSMCLEMVDCIFSAPYDAPELEYALTEDTTAQGGKTYYTLSGSTYTALTVGTDYDIGDPIPVASWYEKNLPGRSTYGSNNPKQNNCINWLNSDGSAGSSIQPMTIWDQCGSALLTRNGFLKNIDPLFLAVVQPAKLTTAICTAEGGGSITHTAKFWTLSRTQIAGTLNNNIYENVQLDYYRNGGSKLKKMMNGSSNILWYLRSPDTTTSHQFWTIYASGIVEHANANYDSGGISPACIIA